MGSSRASTRHKREIQGVDAAGETPGDHDEPATLPQPVPPVYGTRNSPVDVELSVDLSSGWANAVSGRFTVSALPTGLSMDTYGLATGTPTVQPEAVSVQVANDGVAAEAFTWNITL